MLAKGVTPWSVPPEVFEEQIRNDIKLWGGIARSVNARAD
jgi:hypothetical protein